LGGQREGGALLARGGCPYPRRPRAAHGSRCLSFLGLLPPVCLPRSSPKGPLPDTTKWTTAALSKDPLAKMILANTDSVRSAFFWCDHTFTHEVMRVGGLVASRGWPLLGHGTTPRTGGREWGRQCSAECHRHTLS
jgi:hypothetical protein